MKPTLTPTPIRYEDGGLVDSEGTRLASVPFEPIGQEIVRAVNSHEALLASVKELQEQIIRLGEQSNIDTVTRNSGFQKSQQAIAKAEGRSA